MNGRSWILAILLTTSALCFAKVTGEWLKKVPQADRNRVNPYAGKPQAEAAGPASHRPLFWGRGGPMKMRRGLGRHHQRGIWKRVSSRTGLTSTLSTVIFSCCGRPRAPISMERAKLTPSVLR